MCTLSLNPTFPDFPPPFLNPSPRTDSGALNKNNVGAAGYSWEGMTGEGLKEAFTKAGFGPRYVMMVLSPQSSLL